MFGLVISLFYCWCLLFLPIFPLTVPVIKCLAAPNCLENKLISLVNVLKLHSWTSSRAQLLFKKIKCLPHTAGHLLRLFVTKDIASVDKEPLELLLCDVVDVDGPGAVGGGHLVIKIKQLNGWVFWQRPARTAHNFTEGNHIIKTLLKYSPV